MPFHRIFVLVLVALAGGVGSAQAQEKASYSFTDDEPLVLAQDKTTDAAGVQNDGGRTAFVAARVQSLRRLDGKDAPPSNLVFKDPDDIAIQPGGRASVEVALRPDALDRLTEGEYAAELVLTGQHLTRGPPVRKSIGLAVTSTALVPLRGQVAFDGVDDVPVASAPDVGGIVPLAPAADGSAVTREEVPLQPGQPIGAVSSADGEQATVVWTGELDEASPGIAALRVRAEDLPGSGTYDGTLDLQPADPRAGEVALHVRVTDMALWPLVALVLGVALAWMCELLVRGGPRRANKPWWRTAAGRGRSLLDRARGRRGLLPGSGSFAFPSLSRDEVKRVRHALACIEIARRDDARPELPALSPRADAVASADRPPPFLAAGLSAALTDSRRGDVSTAVERSPAIERTLELLDAWPGLREAVWTLWSNLGDAEQEPLDDGARATLAAARSELRRLVLDLQSTPSARELSVPELQDRLSRVRAKLGKAFAEPSASPGTDLEQTAAAVPMQRPSMQAQAAQHEAVRRRRSRLLEALAIVITLATGMATLYFGETFGDAEQYLAAVIWGFVVKVLCDLVLTVLTQLRGASAGSFAARD